ncbi:MAG TPA: hypothetical protein VL177_01770, partial [Terriglobales bacterium]|nr:hypothetical protein [Terriglobales bacterium]
IRSHAAQQTGEAFEFLRPLLQVLHDSIVGEYTCMMQANNYLGYLATSSSSAQTLDWRLTKQQWNV